VHTGRAQEAMKSLVNYSVSDRVRPVYLFTTTTTITTSLNVITIP
jgi:hypothetical protein